MPKGDPWDRFFYPTLRLEMDSNNLKTFCFVCFVALHPKSTAIVMAGWSVHLSTLFPEQVVNQYFVHIRSLVTGNSSS